MARIGLKNVRHSYREHPTADADWAVKRLNVEWAEGSANALLGPSGCGKTTLLNIISGLLRPTEGAVFFDEHDVTAAPPDARNIAQVHGGTVELEGSSAQGSVFVARFPQLKGTS